MQEITNLFFMSDLNNQSSSPEELNEKLKKKRVNGSVDWLIKLAVENRFWKPIDQKKFNEFQQNKEALVQAVIVETRGIKYEDPEHYGSIDESEISEDKIIERILSHGRNLALLRERALRRTIEICPELDWEKLSIKTELSLMNEKSLQNLIDRKNIVKNFIQKNYSQFPVSTPNEREVFEQIFDDISKMVPQGSDQELKCLKIVQDYKTYWQKPGTDEIAFLLFVYSKAPTKRKIRLLQELWAQVSIAFALRYTLIDDRKLDEIAKNIYGDQFEELGKETQQRILDGLNRSEIKILTVGDLNHENLAKILDQKNARKQLAEEIFQSIVTADDAEDLKRIEDRTINQKIREKKLKEAEEAWEEEPNYDLYEAFIDEVAKMMSKKGGPLVKNSHLLYEEGTVIEFNDPTFGTQYIRIKRVRDSNNQPLEVSRGLELGIELEGMPIVDGQLRQSQYFTSSYDHFLEILQNLGDAVAIRGWEFETDIITKDRTDTSKFLDIRDIEDTEVKDEKDLEEKINLLDPTWSEFKFGEGTVFIGSSTDEKGKLNNNEIWTVYAIKKDSGGNITVSLLAEEGFVVEWIPLQEIYNGIKDNANFKRIGKVSREGEDMINALKEKWLDHDAKIKDGKIIVPEKDDHGHGKEKKISCYTSEKWWHIRLFSIQDGVVEFGEFDQDGEELEVIKKHAAEHGYDKEIQRFYKKRKYLSYGAFLKYLEKEKFEKSDTDPILPSDTHGHEDHDHYDAHMSGSIFKRMMKWQNPASIMKGFEMLYHGIEHTLEKWAKLDAARFAMSAARMVWAGETAVWAQVYADITSASKEIVEKYEQKIFGLPGPAGRWKCIHIAHDRDSRPEEVAAAMNYMLKSYGQLYSEDIKHYQSIVNQKSIKTAKPWYFAFLDGFIITAKLWNLESWRQKAYDRAITEMGTKDNHEGEPTEEQLIHALMKQIDGKWNLFPYAASVVKAIGGPSWYEKNYRTEWFDSAKKKGVDQTQMVNVDGRVNKAVGYLKTHEIYKAVGAMEAVAGKDKSPKYQVIPFIWCVWGFSGYATHHALQQIKTYAEWWFTFHAFSFMRNKADNDLYSSTVRLALEDIGKEKWMWDSLVKKFDDLKAAFTYDHNDPEKTEKAGMELTKFWQEWEGQWLHDMLQGHNGWLVKKNHEWNSTARNYLKTLSGKHMMQLNDSNIPWNPTGKDWFDEHGIRMSRIMTFDEKTGLLSLKRMLNKIRLYGTKTWDKKMQTVEYEKLWEGVKEQMNAIRDPKYFGGNLELQEKQYQLYRKEIIEYFATELTARSVHPPLSDDDIKRFISLPHEYLDDLRNMGIDPYEIYSADHEAMNTRPDYENWKSSLSSGSTRKKKDTPIISEIVRKKSEKIVRRNNVRPTKTDLHRWKDEDSRYKGGVADAWDWRYYSEKAWRIARDVTDDIDDLMEDGK